MHGNPRNKSKTVWRPSQIYNGNPYITYINKTVPFYWIGAQMYIRMIHVGELGDAIMHHII